METDASLDRRDAFAASVALLVLAVLWMVLRLYWQGALLLAAGLGLGYAGWFRSGRLHRDPDGGPPGRDADRARGSGTAERTPGKADRAKGKPGRKKGKKRKR